MPFNVNVGTTMTYQSAKATNWQPGDYTKWTNQPQNQQEQANRKQILYNIIL